MHISDRRKEGVSAAIFCFANFLHPQPFRFFVDDENNPRCIEQYSDGRCVARYEFVEFNDERCCAVFLFVDAASLENVLEIPYSGTLPPFDGEMLIRQDGVMQHMYRFTVEED